MTHPSNDTLFLNRLLITGCLLFSLNLSHADGLVVNKTKSKLIELEHKISHLKQTISTATDKQNVLNKELSLTETQIGEGINQLRTIQQNLTQTQEKIAALKVQISQLNQHLSEQQQKLADHIRTRYKMGAYQPLKWLLNQENPYEISRLLTFYQYVIQSRQQLINNIQTTSHNLLLNTEKLNVDLHQEQALQQQLTQKQQKLGQAKLYHKALIDSLNQDIQTSQQTLKEFQHNKDNLTHLLTSLAEQSVVRIQYPFINMKRKLPRPIQNNSNSFEKMNQGIMFFANEGEPVSSVFPGKVVFSDWLRGYGLLLIIDHGNGFMTLYAHNQSLYKQKGQTVRQGESIASVGHSGGILKNGLYFEVRQRGKAVPPLEWLS